MSTPSKLIHTITEINGDVITTTRNSVVKEYTVVNTPSLTIGQVGSFKSTETGLMFYTT